LDTCDTPGTQSNFRSAQASNLQGLIETKSLKLLPKRPRWYDNPYFHALLAVTLIGGLLIGLILYAFIRT